MTDSSSPHEAVLSKPRRGGVGLRLERLRLGMMWPWLSDVAAKTHSLDNAVIIKTLHKGVWPTIEGNLSWDANGSPKGADSLVEWVGGKLLPVYPANVARHAPTIPKPAWTG